MKEIGKGGLLFCLPYNLISLLCSHLIELSCLITFNKLLNYARIPEIIIINIIIICKTPFPVSGNKVSLTLRNYKIDRKNIHDLNSVFSHKIFISSVI
jgi:hypothetical protein